jgi:hypothetical protein
LPPSNAGPSRASYISWLLMIGKNIIKPAQEDGA